MSMSWYCRWRGVVVRQILMSTEEVWFGIWEFFVRTLTFWYSSLWVINVQITHQTLWYVRNFWNWLILFLFQSFDIPREIIQWNQRRLCVNSIALANFVRTIKHMYIYTRMQNINVSNLLLSSYYTWIAGFLHIFVKWYCEPLWYNTWTNTLSRYLI